MSISTIAAQLYTIQARKNVPLKTAFSMLVREDLAMRFSVYNLTKILTKSEFLATVAQTAFGKRTPIQRKQDKIEREQDKSNNQFKQFTTASIATINRKLSLLATITERNSALISGLYSEIGSYRGQRRIDPKLFNSRASRIPVMSKTIKNNLERLNKEIELLKKPKKERGRVTGVVAREKTKKAVKEDKKDFISSFLPLLLRYPRLLTLFAGGATAAIGLGSFAAQAYSLYNMPGAFGRVAGRFSGRAGFQDPGTEQVSQFVDPAIVGIGTYTVGRMATAGAMALRTKPPVATAAQGRMGLINKYIKEYRAQGMDYRTAQKRAGEKASLAPRYANQTQKFSAINKIFGGLAKRLPAVAAADVAITVSRMSGFVSDHSIGRMPQQEYKNNMVEGYADLISTVGITGASTILGGLAGTALFPGIGTLGGSAIGGIFGYVASLFAEESQSIQALATKMFEIIHENKSHTPKRQFTEVKVEGPPDRIARRGENPPELTQSRGRVSEALNDPEFINEVYRVSSKFEINPLDLLEVMYLETAGTLSPSIKNPTSSATGLIQFTEATAKSLGTTTASLKMMTRSGQMAYVEKYFDMVKLPKGASKEQIYGHVFLPSMAQKGLSVFADKNDPNTARYYELNKNLDIVEPFGKITEEDFRARLTGLSNILPARTAQMIRESNPLINITPNVAVSNPPPTNTAPSTSTRESDGTQEAQVESRAALQVSAATNAKIDRVQSQLNDHDGRLNIQEINSRLPLARNTEFEQFHSYQDIFGNTRLT